MYEEVLSDLMIRNVRSVNTIFSDVNSSAKRLNREAWGILIKFEGESEYICNGKRTVSNAKNMVILPKGVSYEWRCLKAGRYSVIEFDSDRTHDEILEFPLSSSEKVLKIFEELEYRRSTGSRSYRMECIHGAYTILLMLMNLKKPYMPATRMEALQAPLEYIAKNCSRNIRNDELAALTPYSTVYFRKLFREATGLSPITYLHTLRIQKAKEMLRSDYGRISDVAYTLGYVNINEFSRTFKKHTGLSPTEYIRLHREPVE